MANVPPNKFGNSTQYVSRAYTQSPGSVQSNKINTIQQPPNNPMNLNISELYKQYAQKSFIAADAGGSQLQQYNTQQRSNGTAGQGKHRAISVTETPKPLMDTQNQTLGMQSSV